MSARPLPVGFHSVQMNPKIARDIFKLRQPAAFVDALPDAAALAYALCPYAVLFVPRSGTKPTQDEQRQARLWVHSWAAVGCIGAALTQPAVDGYAAALVAALQPMHLAGRTAARRGIHQVGVPPIHTPIALFIQSQDTVAVWLGPPPWRVIPQGIAPPIWSNERTAEMWYRRAIAATRNQFCSTEDSIGLDSK